VQLPGLINQEIEYKYRVKTLAVAIHRVQLKIYWFKERITAIAGAATDNKCKYNKYECFSH